MNDMKEKTGALLKEMAVLTGAVAIVAAGVYFFLVPSHTSMRSLRFPAGQVRWKRLQR